MVLTDAKALPEDPIDSAHSLPLIPLPAHVRPSEGHLLLPSLQVEGDPATAALMREDLRRLASTAGPEAAHAAGNVVLALTDDAAAGPEGYTLDTRDDGIRITARDSAGLYYGTRTLLQLLRRADEGWSVPRILIEDAPRFAYRGVMLDVTRHFFSVSEVTAYVDRAVALKFNHLHLHLTDDQGWRIQIDSWPRLAERASEGDAGEGPGGFFTKDDYRQIVEYAADRHMTVVPEIDLPGHTHAVGVAYPDLVEEPWITDQLVAEVERLAQPVPVHGEHFSGWAVGHSSLRIGEERAYDFVKDVLDEVAAMTPGPYLHIGGDECLGTSPADFAVFMTRATRLVGETGKTAIAWHEAGAVHDIAEGTVGQYWGSVLPQGSHAEEATRFVTSGGGLILSPSDRTYLDMKPDAGFPLGLDWAGIVPLRTAYDWDPADVVPGVAESAILGVEAPLWTETVESLEDADALVFPRLTAHAETAWSPREGADRTWESYLSRLTALAPALRASGIDVALAGDEG